MADLLRQTPELAVFLALAIGYYTGKFKIFGISLGTTVATLFAAAVIGQIGLSINPLLKSVLFALFIFTMGYKTGPQFAASFKRSGAGGLILALTLSTTGLALIFLIAWVLHLDKGTAAGIFAGAMTQTPALGTATDAIGGLGLPPDQAKILTDNVAIGYAITYLVAEFALLLYTRNVVPALMGVNLKDAAAALEKETERGGSKADAGSFLAYEPLDVRAYALKNPAAAGQLASVLEAQFGDRTFIARARRGDTVTPVRHDSRLELGDIVCVVGHGSTMAERAASLIGDEVNEPSLLGYPLQTADVVVTKNALDGKTLREVGGMAPGRARGVTVESVRRMGQALPLAPLMRVQRGDVIRIVGDEQRVAEVAAFIGYRDVPNDKSDLVTVALGIVLGMLIGRLTLTVYGMPLTLGTGGGILVSGLILGYLRARRPVFGKVPPAAQWILSDVGLNGFIACIGLSTGRSAVEAIAANGPTMVLAGLVLTTIPLFVATLVGWKILKMHPVLLVGALSGAQTNVAILSALTDACGNSTPVIGFTLPYAVNAMLLTIAAPVIVSLV